MRRRTPLLSEQVDWAGCVGRGSGGGLSPWGVRKLWRVPVNTCSLLEARRACRAVWSAAAARYISSISWRNNYVVDDAVAGGSPLRATNDSRCERTADRRLRSAAILETCGLHCEKTTRKRIELWNCGPRANHFIICTVNDVSLVYAKCLLINK